MIATTKTAQGQTKKVSYLQHTNNIHPQVQKRWDDA